MKIAIVGASGFVGLRLLERFHLGGQHEVLPVVHAFRSLAVLSRFSIPWSVADATSQAELTKAFTGCDAVVHAALGDAKQIVAMAEALYPAASDAGVKRIVALSSASVHGLAPAAGTDETTPILTKQKAEYNSAKAQAEEILTAARAGGKVELVQLRPSIIHGPRSKLVANIAQDLLGGTAYLVGKGDAICNSIAVDNLIDAINLALTTPAADREVFLVNDAETVTWREFYHSIGRAVGADLERIQSITPPQFVESASDRLARLAAGRTAMAMMPRIPARVKRLAKAAAAAWGEPSRPNAWKLEGGPQPQPTEEMCELQSCTWRYPTAKAERILGYRPALRFPDAMDQTARWLKFAGISRAG